MNFVGMKTLKFGVFDSIITYNAGNKGRIKVLQNLGLKPGADCIKILLEIDVARVQNAERANSEDIKKRRKHARTIKKRKLDSEKEEDAQYAAGMLWTVSYNTMFTHVCSYFYRF